MWDILKRKKDWEIKDAQSRAFVKILKKRMPELSALLDDWGYYDLDSWTPQLPWVYTDDSKKNYLQRITPGFRYRDLITFDNIRNDRLKCEIFINITFEPRADKEDTYELSYDGDITITLGDKEIITFPWKDDNTRVHILNLIRNYYGLNKELFKQKNIYTTLRFNGMSIRSYVYSVNRLGDQSLNDMKIINVLQRPISFAEFVEYLTGNTLSHYGGAQTKLFKKENKKQINLKEATEKAHLENIRKICLEKFKKDTPFIPYTNMEVSNFHRTTQELLNLDLEELKQADFTYELEVMNSAKLRPTKRRVKTRDVKIKDKEKGDWEASFEVIDLEIYRLEVYVYIGDDSIATIKIYNPKDFIYLLKDKLSEFKNAFKDLTWFSRPYLFDDTYRYRQMHGERGIKARSPDTITNKKIISDLRARRITPSEAEKLFDQLNYSGLADIKPQQHWKKKLRRKQYPVQMAFLHYQNRYVLYNSVKLRQLFPGWRKL